MSKSTMQSYNAQALNATGLAAAVAYANGGYALGVVSSPDSLGHQITFHNKSGTDHSGQNITFSGKDENGNPQSEVIVGPVGSATLTTVGHYLQNGMTITSSATTGADTFDIGWTADAVGAHVHPENDRMFSPNVEIFCQVPSGSSPGFGVDYTADKASGALTSTSWLAHSTIAGKSATFDGQLSFPVAAIRLHFTAAGKVNMTVLENSNPAMTG